MSAVQQALYKLSQAVENLETSLGGLEGSLKGKQRDMFAQPPPKEKIANNNGLEPKVIAKKLDGAIARIESVLKEGRR